MSIFQIVVTSIFAALILIGVGIFATQSKINGNNTVGKVTIWGTVDTNTVQQLIVLLRQQDQSSYQGVEYIQKDPKTYTSDVINAMASGSGPDLFFIPQDEITAFSDKIVTIPYSAVSQQSFTDAYIDEGRLFLTPNGALALPFMIDPLVMYWNRDLLANAGVAKPPTNWNDFLDIAPRLTVLDASNNIKTSTVAMGEWSNVLYAKDILATLMMQAGDTIVERNAAGTPMPVLENVPPGATENPASSALQFYTEFANPSKKTYSWNRALPMSQDDFVAGDLALYMGFASDYATILARNPNLHFAVALLPQINGGSVKLTFGRMTALAIARTSPNPNGALSIAQKLTSQGAITGLAQYSPLPPVRRDVTLDTSSNAAQAIFTQSALISRGWLDPDSAQTDAIFADMIQSVVSGKAQPSTAIFNAQQALEGLLHTYSGQTQ